jgi:hypothetical protein
MITVLNALSVVSFYQLCRQWSRRLTPEKSLGEGVVAALRDLSSPHVRHVVDGGRRMEIESQLLTVSSDSATQKVIHQAYLELKKKTVVRREQPRTRSHRHWQENGSGGRADQDPSDFTDI